MKISKIIARFKDGSLLKGETNDFSPDKSFFNLKLKSGEFVKIDMKVLKKTKVNIEDLKAVYFVKDFQGNKNRKDEYKDFLPWGDKRIKVRFFDGEEIVGYASHHSSSRYGFFITPADQQGNNERIFVVTSATEKVTFL